MPSQARPSRAISHHIIYRIRLLCVRPVDVEDVYMEYGRSRQTREANEQKKIKRNPLHRADVGSCRLCAFISFNGFSICMVCVCVAMGGGWGFGAAGVLT